MFLKVEIAAASLAAMRARSKFGIAMAAMIRMIATTISSSISEKPLLRLMDSSHNAGRRQKDAFIRALTMPVEPLSRTAEVPI
jgi:preprotein translocase subunit SecF